MVSHLGLRSGEPFVDKPCMSSLGRTPTKFYKMVVVYRMLVDVFNFPFYRSPTFQILKSGYQSGSFVGVWPAYVPDEAGGALLPAVDDKTKNGYQSASGRDAPP